MAEFSGSDHNLNMVAMDSLQVAARAVEGTVVAAECCYGAQLYDPKLVNAEVPICSSYIAKGALGFFGSTNVAFGSVGSEPNRQADLITRFFFENVLRFLNELPGTHFSQVDRGVLKVVNSL